MGICGQLASMRVHEISGTHLFATDEDAATTSAGCLDAGKQLVGCDARDARVARDWGENPLPVGHPSAERGTTEAFGGSIRRDELKTALVTAHKCTFCRDMRVMFFLHGVRIFTFRHRTSV